MLLLSLFVTPSHAAPLPETDFYAFGPATDLRVAGTVSPPPPWSGRVATSTFTLLEVDEACGKVDSCATLDAAAKARMKTACDTMPAGGAPPASWVSVAAAFADPKQLSEDLGTVRKGCAAGSSASVTARMATESPGGAAAALMSPSTILLGATDFFLDRAVEEVADWGVDRFLVQICKDGTAKARTIGPIRPGALIPGSCDALDRTRTASLAGTLDDLVRVAMRDLVALPRHTSEEILRADARGLLPGGATSTPSLTPAGRDALVTLAVLGRVVELVAEGRAASDALGDWARGERPAWPADGGGGNLVASPLTLKDDAGPYVLWLASLAAASLPPGTVQVVVDAAASKMQAQFVVDADQLKAMKNRLVLTLAVNLLSGNVDGMVLQPTDAQVESLATLGNSLQSGYEDAREVVRQVMQWRIKAMSGEKGTPESVAMAAGQVALSVARMGGASLDASASIVDLFGKASESPNLLATMTATRTILKDATDTLSMALEKEYADAIVAGLHTVYDVVDAACGDDKPKALAALAAISRAIDFVTALSEAKDPASAKEAIEAIAAPTGGYISKRRGTQPLYGTLNGYVGAGGGVEVALPGTGDAVAGIVAPEVTPVGAVWPTIAVGPEVGVRLFRFRENAASLGFQVQLIDLGVLGQYRLGGGGDSVADLAFQHVFSPGVNMAVGLPKAPFSLLVGGALAPSLRDLSTDGVIAVREANTVRVGGSLVVDIPVFH